MPKGYQNKDKNNEVYKPEGKRSMDYLSKDGPPKRDVTYTQKRDVNYTPIKKSVNWNRILAIVIPMLLILIVWMIVRTMTIQSWEAEDAKMLQECYNTLGRNDPLCDIYK